MRRLVDSSTADADVLEWAQGVVRYIPERDPDAAAQAFLSWTRSNMRYTEDPTNRESIKTPEAMVKEFLRYGRVTGDCVATVPVQSFRSVDGGGVRTLVATAEYLHELANGAARSPEMVLNHSGGGSPLKKTISKGVKRVIAVTTRKGGTLVATPDHRVRSGGEWRKLGDLAIGDKLDRADPSVLQVDPGTEDEAEEAWVHGLISADGTMGEYDKTTHRKDGGKRPSRFAWRLTNNDVGLLLRAKAVLERIYTTVKFSIQQYNSEAPGSATRFHTTKHISHLVVQSGGEKGSRNDFIRLMIRKHLHGDQKIIPSFVFSTLAGMRGWLSGYNDGDGWHNGNKSKHLKYELTIGDKLIAAAVPVLLDSLGEEYSFKKSKGSVCCRVYSANSDSIKCHRSDRRKADCVIDIQEAGQMPVYDVVADGEFVAGVFRVHNCDDHVVLIAAGLNSIGVPTEFIVVAADGNFPNDYSHVLMQYQSKSGEWITMDPIVRGTGPGWFPPRVSRIGYYRQGRLSGLGGSRGSMSLAVPVMLIAAYMLLKAR
jgi:transglutaminase-like putative cysteine protease